MLQSGYKVLLFNVVFFQNLLPSTGYLHILLLECVSHVWFYVLDNVEKMPNVSVEVLQTVKNRYAVSHHLILRLLFWYFFYIFVSVFGWDYVVQGIVHLGFYLMDTFGSKHYGICRPNAVHLSIYIN